MVVDIDSDIIDLIDIITVSTGQRDRLPIRQTKDVSIETTGHRFNLSMTQQQHGSNINESTRYTQMDQITNTKIN